MHYQLLAGLAEAERRAVLAATRRRKYPRGGALFYEGDPGDTLHLLAKGRVAIRVTTPGGDTATVAIMPTGSSFGEQALLADRPERSATAVAMEDVETLTLSREDFHALRAKHDAVAEVLVDELARQVRRLTAQLSEALYVPVEPRVLRRVLELDEVYDHGRIAVTQEDIATMAGTTRSTANRVLQQAADAGLLEIGRGRVQVLDRDGLVARAR